MKTYSNVTVIIPVRNEEKHIEQCVESVLKQTYPKENIKVIFVDGDSTDKTKEIIKKYIEKYSELFSVEDNPKKIAPCAMNIGIRKAETEYIIRLDAHSEYSENYIEKCMDTILSTNADNVGGLALSKGIGRTGEAFAQVLSSKFGVGNSGFRTGAKSGYVDTVPFGTFQKETFEKYGLYDERLVRNQDYELNYRIRKNGGKIYLNSDIRLYYNCKNKIKDILKQSYGNGKWNVITMKLCPGSMGVRHFIPLLFLLSLLIMPILTEFISLIKVAFILELVLYLLLDIAFSIKNDEKSYRNHFWCKLVLFPMFHISYGLGSLIGLFQCMWIKN